MLPAQEQGAPRARVPAAEPALTDAARRTVERLRDMLKDEGCDAARAPARDGWESQRASARSIDALGPRGSEPTARGDMRGEREGLPRAPHVCPERDWRRILSGRALPPCVKPGA